MDHLLNWIELPATDLTRAQAFYEELFETKLINMDMGPLRYALFPTKSSHNTGALVQGEGYVPGASGPTVYLDATGRMEALLARVAAGGGKVLMPRTLLSPEAGHVAMFVDTEGNRIGLQEALNEPASAPISDETMQRLLGAAETGLSFLVRRGPAFDDPARQPLQWEHARNMFALLRAGKLRAVSALMDSKDVLGVGRLITRDRSEAEQILREDPAVRGGRLHMELVSDVTFLADSTRF